MFIATVKKLDGTYLDHGRFESEASALAWFQPFIDKGIYGQKHIPSQVIPAVLDEQGNVISPEHVTEEIPSAFVIEFEDVTAQEAAEKSKIEKIEAGQKAREACTNVLDLISGSNLGKSLTLEQITDMQAIFGTIEKALQSGRPTLAKGLISAVEPDGILVTEELKADCLQLLANY
jgi:hypothetical protein